MPRPPKAVTFDCWSTLIQDIDWDATAGHRRDALIHIAAHRGVHLDSERAMELLAGSWQEHMAHWRNGKLFGPAGAAKWVLSRLDLEATGEMDPSIDDRLASELTDAIADATSSVGTRVVEGAPEALDALRERGIPTALICDTGFTPGSHVRKFLDEHGIVLDHYLFSDEVGSPKPYPPIFHKALELTEVSPADAVHIGDLRRTDIAGARAVGMATIRFIGVHDDGWNPQDVSGEEADAVLDHWGKLPEILGL